METTLASLILIQRFVSVPSLFITSKINNYIQFRLVSFVDRKHFTQFMVGDSIYVYRCFWVCSFIPNVECLSDTNYSYS